MLGGGVRLWHICDEIARSLMLGVVSLPKKVINTFYFFRMTENTSRSTALCIQ